MILAVGLMLTVAPSVSYSGEGPPGIVAVYDSKSFELPSVQFGELTEVASEQSIVNADRSDNLFENPSAVAVLPLKAVAGSSEFRDQTNLSIYKSEGLTKTNIIVDHNYHKTGYGLSY